MNKTPDRTSSRAASRPSIARRTLFRAAAPLLAGMLPLAATARPPESKAEKKEESIGVAEMKADRTIVLRLRAKGPGNETGEGYFVYPPAHPEYQKILDHVGPLAPGQSVSVRPWKK